MTEYLAEQMRSLTRRLEELAQATMPDTGLEGSLNPKQLAELLGVSDLQTFTRSMNKIRAGDADKLTRAEMTELAEAFVRLLAAEAEDTQKAMLALKRVSAKEEPVMEDAGKEHISVTYSPHLPMVNLLDYKSVDLKNAPPHVKQILQHYQDIRDGKGVSGRPVARQELMKQFAMDLVKAGYKGNAKMGEPVMEDASKDHISVTYSPNASLLGLLDYKSVDLKNAPPHVKQILQHYQDIRDGKGVSGRPVARQELIQQFAKDLIKAGYKDNAKL